MNCFDTNSAFLSERFPGFAEQILSTIKPAEGFYPEQSSQGAPTARYCGVYLHSRLDPLREAERLVSREIPKDTRCCIIEGFGLGYHVEAVLNQFPGIPCIVIEADIPLFLSALSMRDFRPVFSREEFSLLLAPSPEALVSIEGLFTAGKVSFLKFRPTYEKDHAYYERIDSVISSAISRREINSNTLKRFGRLWVKNLVRNIPLIAKTEGIERFIGRFSGLPAFICAAGPSLDASLPLLSEIRKRFVLIAVDTSYRSVLEAGVDPDFVVVVDPQYWNSRHLDWVRSSRAVLISESATHPRVFRTPVLRTFFAASLFPLGTFLENYIGKKPQLGAGGSVSTTAWDFARICGAVPILFAGLDLGFPDKQTHYRGSFFEERSHTESTRMKPAETASFLALRDGGPYLAENNSGGMTLTDRRLSVYSSWFEAQLSRHPEAQTYTLSPNGIRIEGMPYAELRSVLSYPVIRDEIDRRMEAALCSIQTESLPTTGNSTTPSERVTAAFDDLRKELEELKALTEEGLRVIEQMKNPLFPQEETAASLLALDSIDRRIRASSSREVVGFLARPVLEEIIGSGGGKMDTLTVLQNSEKMYAEILESVRFHLSVLEKPKETMLHTEDYS